MTKDVSVLVKCDTIFRLFFLELTNLPQIQTSNFRLQLNADKSEVVFLETSAQLRSATNITIVDDCDGLVNAVPNMQKMLLQFITLACLDKIVCYLQRIFNRNQKLKRQVSK